MKKEATSTTTSNVASDYIQQNVNDGAPELLYEHSSVLSIPSGSKSIEKGAYHLQLSLELGTLESTPVQPVLEKYPFAQYKLQKRSFSAKFFKEYSWLEYSIQCDAVFCYYCRLLGCKTTNEAVFTETGFRNWQKLKEKLQKHARTAFHVNNVEKYLAYQQHKKQGSVASQISSVHREFIQKHRNYFKIMSDIVLTLSCQGIALRGHDESENSSNKGNLKQICELVARHNSSFSELYGNYFNLSSKDIQNEIISIASDLLRKKIVSDVNDCGMFSIMVDEARSFKQEQLSICVRFTDIDFEIQERFLGFFDCSAERDATNMSELIIANLKKLGLSNIPLVGQSYDGASVMSGRIGGVQTKLKVVYPQAIYIHCLAHRLNLAVVDTCGNIEGLRAFFNTLQALYVHFSQPSLHAKFIDLQKTLNLNPRVTQLTSLSDTRWNCRAENCEKVMKNFHAINHLLEEEVEHNETKRAVEAVGILKCITNITFLAHLFVLTDVLKVINILSKSLQSKGATLARSSNIINSIIKTLEKKRSDDVSKLVWKEIEALARNNNVEIPTTNVKRKRKESTLLKRYVVMSSIGSTSNAFDSRVLPEDSFRINIYYRILDAVTGHLKIRFSLESQEMANAVDNFLKFDLSGSSTFIDHYATTFGIDRHLLEAEMMILRNTTDSKSSKPNPEEAISELKKVLKLNQYTFGNYYKLFKVAVILPVTSASCERSFSAMRRMRNWLRTTMTQNRFNNLSILNIENELAKTIDSEDVLQEFIRQQGNRKMPLQS